MPSELILWPRKSTVGAAKVHLSGRIINLFSWSRESTSPKYISCSELLSENTRQVVLVYGSMGKLAEDIIHHALECGAAVLDTVRGVMENIDTKRSYDRCLRYVHWVYGHMKISFKLIQPGETRALPILVVRSVMFGIG